MGELRHLTPGQLHFFVFVAFVAKRALSEGRDTPGFFVLVTRDFQGAALPARGGKQTKKQKETRDSNSVGEVLFGVPEESFYPFILVTRGRDME